jgi:hypothetical protein
LDGPDSVLASLARFELSLEPVVPLLEDAFEQLRFRAAD